MYSSCFFDYVIVTTNHTLLYISVFSSQNERVQIKETRN